MTNKWKDAWDGDSLVYLKNLAVRFYAMRAMSDRADKTLYKIDDAPRQKDGVVELSADQSVPGDFPAGALDYLESVSSLRVGGVRVSLDDDVLSFSLARSFEDLEKEELLALTDDEITQMVTEDLKAMDTVYLGYKTAIPREVILKNLAPKS